LTRGEHSPEAPGVPMTDADTISMSAVGLGCDNFGVTLDLKQARDVVSAAIDEGVTLFDTADIYGYTTSERFLGQALGPRRSDVTVTTKFGIRHGELAGGAGPAYVRTALEASLRRLGTDHVDIFMMHYPSSWMAARGYPGGDTPIADTLSALNDLVKAGKARAIGSSNFSVDELREADDAARSSRLTRFTYVQDGLSLLDRRAESGVLPLCTERSIVFQPYLPLAGGLLTGKYRRGEDYPVGSRMASRPKGIWAPLFNDRNLECVERLRSFAADHGHSLLELAMSWLLTRPRVGSIIAGATTVEQVKLNVAATRWVLTSQELADIDALLA
jgi:aryl-alcohol dehydrogenase-like predicted oxidoreductase